MKPSRDCTSWPMGGGRIELYWRKQGENWRGPLGHLGLQSSHGSPVRYVQDPMTQDHRCWGVVGHMSRCQRSRLGAQDRSSLFFVIPFGRRVTILHTPPMLHGPWASSVQVSSMEGTCACAFLPMVNNTNLAQEQVVISLVR